MKTKSVVITGGCGFVGSHLAEYYLQQNYKVFSLDNFCTGLRSNAKDLTTVYGKQFQVIETDVSQSWDCWISKHLPALENQLLKYIFHFASPASPPLYQALNLETMRVNSVGLEQALKWADHCGARVIFASTSEVYGDPLSTPQREVDWGHVNSFGPRSCYDESKRFGEALIYSYNLRHKTRHGLVRIFNTYGPRMNPRDGRVIINLLTQALKNENLTIFGDGSQTRSFCYISDLLEGIVRYADSQICEPINLGNETEFTILELSEIICKIFPEKKLKIDFLPLPKDDPTRRRPDTTKARQQLNGWQATVKLEEGLVAMLNWLRTQDFGLN